MKDNRINIVIFVLLAVRFWIAFQGYSGDINNHISWAKSAAKFGLSGIYERDYPGTMRPTYPPPTLYLFTIEYQIYHQVYTQLYRINQKIPVFPSRLIWYLERPQALPAFLKLQSIFSDLFLAIILGKIASSLKPKSPLSKLIPVFWLANPAVIHNSSYWGQIESLPLLFVFLSVLSLINKRTHLAHVSFAMALLSKQSSLVFFPAFLIWSHLKFGTKKTLQGLLIQTTCFIVAYLPIYGLSLGNSFRNYIHIISVGSGSDYITDHAFNTWVLLSGLGKVHDSVKYLAFSAGTWGKLLTGVFLAWPIYLSLKKKTTEYMIYLMALLPLVSFLFLTRMHERYLEAALPAALLLSLFLNRNIIVYLTLSAINFLNLYHNWESPIFPAFNRLLSNNLTISSISAANLVTFLLLLYHLKTSQKSRTTNPEGSFYRKIDA